MTNALSADTADFKGHDAMAQNEIDTNANQEYIDITPENSPSKDVEKQESAPKDVPGPDGLTEAEKAEIHAQERAEAEAQMQDGPDF